MGGWDEAEAVTSGRVWSTYGLVPEQRKAFLTAFHSIAVDTLQKYGG